MKGLTITTLVLAAMLVIGISISFIIYNDLNDKLVTAHALGLEEGRVQGYQTGFKDGSQVGYQEGSKIGYQKSSPRDGDSSQAAGFHFVYNPTYAEVQEILGENETDSAVGINEYVENSGIRVAYVRVQIARKAPEGMVYIFQLVAFETVDKGLVVIEPWSHEEVKVEVGQRYSELNGRPTSPNDDTITKITIVW